MYKIISTLIIVLTLASCKTTNPEPKYYTKLYDGNYLERTQVSYFQVNKSNNKPFREVLLSSVNGKEIIDDTVAFELVPGKHEIKYSCKGSDGKEHKGSQEIYTKPNYFYELTARDNGFEGCFIVFQMFGKVVKVDNSFVPKNHPKGHPLPSSISFHSIFERYEKDHKGLIWPEVTSSIYKFLTSKYDCEYYKVTKVNQYGSGRLWQEEGNSELSIDGNLGEKWSIVACSQNIHLKIMLEKPGNYGRYISLYEL